MKKMIALVLSLVLALSLTTMAFSAITLWGENGTTAIVDSYEGWHNTKDADSITMKYFAAKAPTYDADGSCTAVGNVAYYQITAVATTTDTSLAQVDAKFVMVSSIPTNADASEYVIVKAHNGDVTIGNVIGSQTANDGYYYMKKVDAVQYAYTGKLFTAWADTCEHFAAPLDAKSQSYYTNGFNADKVADADAYTDADAINTNVLVDAAVVTLDMSRAVEMTKHSWVASKYNESSSAVIEYTCARCKGVGTVINSPVNAPAGQAIDKLPDGTLVAYKSIADKDTGADADVESPKTFDAGIAMYVGMGLMAVTGSAVVIGRKKAF